MSLSILGGKLKGLQLNIQNPVQLRPTSVMLRRKLYDAFQDFSDIIFIDLCAGTGSMGIEALSRNAAELYLVEKNLKNFKSLKSSVEAIRAKGDYKIKLFNKDGQQWLKHFREKYATWSNSKQAHCFLFIDPPYEMHDFYFQIINNLKEGWFKGVVCIESDRLKGPSFEEIEKRFCVAHKKFEHSDSYLFLVDLE